MSTGAGAVAPSTTSHPLSPGAQGFHFHVSWHGLEFDTSEGVFTTIERAYEFGLTWSGQHPTLACIDLFGFLLMLLIWQQAGVKGRRLKADYRDALGSAAPRQRRKEPKKLPNAANDDRET